MLDSIFSKTKKYIAANKLSKDFTPSLDPNTGIYKSYDFQIVPPPTWEAVIINSNIDVTFVNSDQSAELNINFPLEFKDTEKADEYYKKYKEENIKNHGIQVISEGSMVIGELPAYFLEGKYNVNGRPNYWMEWSINASNNQDYQINFGNNILNYYINFGTNVDEAQLLEYTAVIKKSVSTFKPVKN